MDLRIAEAWVLMDLDTVLRFLSRLVKPNGASTRSAVVFAKFQWTGARDDIVWVTPCKSGHVCRPEALRSLTRRSRGY